MPARRRGRSRPGRGRRRSPCAARGRRRCGGGVGSGHGAPNFVRRTRIEPAERTIYSVRRTMKLGWPVHAVPHDPDPSLRLLWRHVGPVRARSRRAAGPKQKLTRRRGRRRRRSSSPTRDGLAAALDARRSPSARPGCDDALRVRARPQRAGGAHGRPGPGPHRAAGAAARTCASASSWSRAPSTPTSAPTRGCSRCRACGRGSGRTWPTATSGSCRRSRASGSTTWRWTRRSPCWSGSPATVARSRAQVKRAERESPG